VEIKAEWKSIVFGSGDTKGKKAAESAKDTDSGSQDEGGEHLAADWPTIRILPIYDAICSLA